MKFPKKLKHRGRALATIYAKKPGRPYYRLYWRVNHKTRQKEFRTYAEAKRAGDKLVRDLANGSQVTALTTGQASDALAALEGLQNFYQSTGRRLSLRAVVAEYGEAAKKLHGHTLAEAVERFISFWPKTCIF